MQMEAAIVRGQQAVAACAAVGKVQCLLECHILLHTFANVCHDLAAGLRELDVRALGCDAITTQQVCFQRC